MEEKTISFRQGKGSLTHNNRTFIAENVHKEKIKDNITFIAQPINEAYQLLFGDAVLRHNSQQKRNDRKFADYYQHLFKHDYSNNVIQSSNGEKSFYENIMQIGTMKDTGCSTPDAEIAKECLIEYMNGFQERNPNFYVFNAVLHMDEATPHLHFDYIPVGHYNGRKLDTRNSISRALEEMGFGKGKNAIARWREREWQIMKQICIENGIEISNPEKSHKYMEVQEYKEFKEEMKKAENTLAEKEQQITSANKTLDSIGEEICEKAQQLSDSKNELSSVQEKISSAEEDLSEKEKMANEILNYLPDIDRDDKLEKRYDEIRWELDDYLKNSFTIIKHKNDIMSLINKLFNIVKKAVDLVQKYSTTIFDLREKCSSYKKENSEYYKKIQRLYSERNNLAKENDNLSSQNSYLTDVVKEIEWNNPETLKKAENNIQKRYKLEQQIYQKKKSYEIE